MHAENLSVEEMEKQLEQQKLRAKKIEETCSAEEKGKLEDLTQSVAASLTTAKVDEDDKRKADKQLKDLKIKLDQLEKFKELPQLTKDFNEKIKSIQEMITEYGDQKERGIYEDQLRVLTEEGEQAIKAGDKVILARVNQQLHDLNGKVIFSNPASWVYLFEKVVAEGREWISATEADYYIQKGKRAIEVGDVGELKRSYNSLMLLLPPSVQQRIQGSVSGITK